MSSREPYNSRSSACSSTLHAAEYQLAGIQESSPFSVAAAPLFVLFVLLAGYVANASGGQPVASLLEMRQQNVTIQEWDLSCGAAALTTLLRYQHGDLVSEKEVATALISRAEYIEQPLLVRFRQGFSLLDLKRYVDARGYEGIGYGKMNLGDLEKLAPILVPINTLGYNHFVVFRGRLKDRVLLADPAWGNRTMTIDQFESAWIEYPEVAKVGFVVAAPAERPSAPNRLTPGAEEYVTFN